MDRQQSALAEFAMPDGEAIHADVTSLQRQGLGDAHPGRRQKAKEVVERVGADRALGAQVEGCLQNGLDLPGVQQVRGRAPAGGSS